MKLFDLALRIWWAGVGVLVLLNVFAAVMAPKPAAWCPSVEPMGPVCDEAVCAAMADADCERFSGPGFSARTWCAK